MSRASNHFQSSLPFILRVFSVTVGLVCMFNGFFLDMHFGEAKLPKTVVCVTFTFLYIALLLRGPSLKSITAVCDRNFLLKSVANSILFGSFCLLLILIKCPRFDIHLEYRKSCLEELNRYSLGSQYNFLCASAFALLDVIIASQRHQPTELGSFSILLELVTKISVEIPGNDGPNLWFTLGAALYCVGLIFFRCFAEAYSPGGNRDNYQIANAGDDIRGHGKRESWRDLSRTSLGLFSATVGVVCLFLSPFTKDQFGGNLANTKGVCFIIFALLLFCFMPEIPKLVDFLVKLCNKYTVVKVLVNFSLLVIFSLLSFLNKYPRFNIRSRYSESCSAKNMEKISNGRKFDLCSAGAFSLLALTTPPKTQKQQPMELGVSSFLLRLIMDTSIEILGLETQQCAWYMLGASIYCVVFISVMCYADFGTVHKQRVRYEDLSEIRVIGNSTRGGQNELSSVVSRKSSTRNSDDDGNYVIKGGLMEKINEDVATELMRRKTIGVSNQALGFRRSKEEEACLGPVKHALPEIIRLSVIDMKRAITKLKQNIEVKREEILGQLLMLEKRIDEWHRWYPKILKQTQMPEGSHKMKRRVEKNGRDRKADLKRGHAKNSIIGKRSMGTNGGDIRALDARRKAR